MTTEESSDMQNITQLEDKIDIKIESNELTAEIKSESDNIELKEDDNPFQDIQLEVKEEIPQNAERIKDEFIPEHIKDAGQSIESKEIEITEPKIEEFTITLDREQSEVLSEGYPSQDEGSMDSDEAIALHNVEACLDDEETKMEDYELDHTDAKYKDEMDTGVTETHLISNKFINTTSTVTMPCEGLIESKTTKTLIMEIHPVVRSYNRMSKIGNPEVILPTTNEDDIHDDVCDDFQLNSITGDILPLEQELLQAKKKKIISTEYQYVCPKCPKAYNKPWGLKKHLSVHDCIERRARGVIQGIQTRCERRSMNLYKKVYKKQKPKVDMTQQQIRKDRLEKRLQRIQKSETKLVMDSLSNEDNNYKIEIEINEVRNDNVKREGYVCVCGQMFKRKSRMETCRRSHDTEIDNASHSCVSCSKQFKDKKDLVTHRKRLHRKRFPCKFCPTDYNTRKELFKHLQIHQEVQLTEYKVISEVVKGKQKMKCFMCKNTYTELSDLKSHVMEEHKQPYTCRICKENFSKIMDFCNHTKTNHPQIEGQPVLDVLEAFSKLVKAWKCEECELQFHEADKLAKHQIEEHSPEIKSEAQFQCPDCHRMFVSQKGLTSHARIHHSIENMESEPTAGVMCVECRKICNDTDALTSHMRLHSPERKYPCKFCDFRFTTPEKRKAHAEIHTGDMKFVCFICEYQCSSENRLKQHKMSLKHANMKEFLLTGKPLLQEEPSKSAKKERKEEAKKRKKDKDTPSDDEKELMCDICGEKFSSKKKMLKHKDSHPFIEFPNEDTPTRIFFK